MTNEELLFLLTKYQNSHYKYKMRTKKPFILFIKNKNFPRKVFYVDTQMTELFYPQAKLNSKKLKSLQ